MLMGGVLAAISSTKLKEKTIMFSGLFFLGLATIIEVWSVWPILTGGMRLLTGILLWISFSRR
ncbi:hypothetical protein [Domibacillus epiphyticus]|uniref:Major facilitator superfamily (MFS) profile domain-containing protein n=1 Tax=Domibacillus epiphyticus TaxID=1714355 RepID=A0A1V2AA22_9BACI|nr:hypothetical protein [Domibacillus epiphyticus]OMP67845.1 hypothetical protein BTO28_04990 [Domibacillus epiphyticus]